MSILVVVAVIVVVATVLGLALRNRGTDDGVDSFRRQIDALSSEARKPTVDQVKSAERPEPDDVGGGDDVGGDVAGGDNTGAT